MQEYANGKGVDLIGDMPIYVGGQSADVWANPELFELGPAGAPEQVSGVPPDAFSDTGQLWGSPLYRWDAHAAEDYQWWTQRIGRAGQVRRPPPRVLWPCCAVVPQRCVMCLLPWWHAFSFAGVRARGGVMYVVGRWGS